MNRPDHPTPTPPLARLVLAPLERFLRVEAASGIVLLLATAVALLWANSVWADTYESLWHTPFSIGFGPWIVEQPLHFWINDGLMTIFFLLVGLEIRREMHEGALARWRLAALPVCAALGGIIVPALIYIGINSDPETLRGWAIPTATDIAFAVGVLAVLGKRVPVALRVLLLAIAIIDDIAAVIIIAIFYSQGISIFGLLIGLTGIGVVLAFQRMGVRDALAYVIPGVIVWAGLLQAGVHPTLAGVILGLLTPVRRLGEKETLLSRAAGALDEFRERTQHPERDPHELVAPVRKLKEVQRELLPPVVRVEVAIHPWVAYGIMPLFALANAGVSFTGTDVMAAGATLALGIAVALALGKPLGILLGILIALRARIGELPGHVAWRGLLVVGLLGGIGFTMSLFIANLAFAQGAPLATAKLGILAGSATAAVAGLLVGTFTLRRSSPSRLQAVERRS
ncbi:MAG TPA: Na+/H+ antiporter NhaA [Steroidobacteraceae bacterium]